jgi:LysR family cys regulon transcriptional activator
MAYDRNADSELCSLDAGHLFEPSTTKIGFRKGAFLRGYMYNFIEHFAPHLTREVVEAACGAGTREEIEQLINTRDLPVR